VDLAQPQPPIISRTPIDDKRRSIASKAVDRYPPTRLAPRADHDNLIVVRQVHLFRCHFDTKHRSLKWHLEALLQHGVEADYLLGFVVGVDRCLLDERVELNFRTFRWAPKPVPLLLPPEMEPLR
jgi:hypothetical protein